uniref:SMP-LTD domain-containing protein n=1 Tax=Gasterosteus aculeatus aculeatus TaxID=481459 RepID=A0AAQ4RHF5_GASAC
MEEGKLLFSLGGNDEGPTVAFCKDRQNKRKSQPDFSLGMELDLSLSHHSQPPFLHHSPSSPGSLADLSASSAEPLVGTNLVKSSSTDLKPRESGSLRGKPLLSLVKSLSTEISRRAEPEVNLSKSDSKLHSHPWKQLSRPKIPDVRPAADGLSETDGWASPSADTCGSSLIAELEDTRRKFSEAMQDPLSMLSKIMGDESSGSPKQGRTSGAGDSPSSQGSCGRDGSSEDLRCRRRAEGEHRGGFDTPLRRLPRSSLTESPVSLERHNGDSHLEICTNGDVMQVVEVRRGTHPRTDTQPRVTVPASSLPLHWLFPVGLVAYGFFVLPLPSYVTGLSVGVACGFFLGLVVVFTFAPRRSSARSNNSLSKPRRLHMLLDIIYKYIGWMNETHGYDPETFHPSVTHSVYVTLEGGQLRLAYPTTNIPRWAAFDDTNSRFSLIIYYLFFHLSSQVSLLPPGLARKRIWNKKYPVCVTLAEGEVGEESSVEGKEEKEEEERAERHAAPEHRLPVTLYLFGRTGREKEEWFQHFLSASRPEAQSSVSREENVGKMVLETPEELLDFPGGLKTRTLLEYSTYMTQVIGPQSCSPTLSPCHSDQGSPTAHTKQGATWVNSLVGRIFWDFLREKYWTDLVAQKIQKKLSKIKLPYFMNELTLADLDMGTCLPQVLSTSTPKLDRRGLWLEMEVVYTGCLQMTLQTKMNLCKLGKDGEDEAHSPRLCALADSDEESSSAGSSDEEEASPFEPQVSLHSGSSTSRKILRFVDKIAKSKYFQKATENEFIRKKIAEVSNMPLILSVEVLELSGILAINVPPPPTDRIWYSFRVPPRLELHVRPALGEREVTFTHVTEWIERKLQCEFQKVLVMPNMDDLYLPLMTSDALDDPC